MSLHTRRPFPSRISHLESCDAAVLICAEIRPIKFSSNATRDYILRHSWLPKVSMTEFDSVGTTSRQRQYQAHQLRIST
jgi:hypothetical protein